MSGSCFAFLLYTIPVFEQLRSSLIVIQVLLQQRLTVTDMPASARRTGAPAGTPAAGEQESSGGPAEGRPAQLSAGGAAGAPPLQCSIATCPLAPTHSVSFDLHLWACPPRLSSCSAGLFRSAVVFVLIESVVPHVICTRHMHSAIADSSRHAVCRGGCTASQRFRPYCGCSACLSMATPTRPQCSSRSERTPPAGHPCILAVHFIVVFGSGLR